MAAPPLFISAPLKLVPVPLIVKGRDAISVLPFKSKEPVPLTIAPAVPKGVLTAVPVAPNFNTPALMVVKPVKVLAPESVIVPLPVLFAATPPAKTALAVPLCRS